ncbi:putative peptidyl-tRNA hydrolase 2 [Tubulanus polymorphus]|uniref:putative peptidyl-tRNA hydrolase 2 n=1 Tax=Tubulanus polymorphus TaxID=672921 RepID=UPI003DA47C28
MDVTGAYGGGNFVPNEEKVALLTGMGISRNAAVRALYFTGNQNADLAAAWALDNQDQDIDAPFQVPLESSAVSEDSEDDGAEFLEAGDFHKMVFIVNGELNMSSGKMAAQVGHATLGLYRKLLDDQQKYGEMVLQWEQFGETKIVVKGNSSEHLMQLSAKCVATELPYHLVQDAGRTEVASGSITCLAIMGKTDVVNQVTGNLQLLT